VNVTLHPVADAALPPLSSVAARPPIRYDCRPSADQLAATTAPARACRHCSEPPRGTGIYDFSDAGKSRFHAFADVLADELWGAKPAIELGPVAVVTLAARVGPQATEPVRPRIYLTSKKPARRSATELSHDAGRDVAQ
jgi:hypothetical protein